MREIRPILLIVSSAKKIKIKDYLNIIIFGFLPPLLISFYHSDGLVNDCEYILKNIGLELSLERLRVPSFFTGAILMTLIGPIKVVRYRIGRDNARFAVQETRQELLETFRILWKGNLNTGQNVDFDILVPRKGVLGWWDKNFHRRRVLVPLPAVNTARRGNGGLEYRVDSSRKPKCNNNCTDGRACDHNCYQGVVGLSYYKTSFVFADDIEPQSYNLTNFQSQIVNDVKFVAATPIYDKQNNVSAVLSVYSKEVLGGNKSSEVRELLVQMQKMLYQVVPLK